VCCRLCIRLGVVTRSTTRTCCFNHMRVCPCLDMLGRRRRWRWWLCGVRRAGPASAACPLGTKQMTLLAAAGHWKTPDNPQQFIDCLGVGCCGPDADAAVCPTGSVCAQGYEGAVSRSHLIAVCRAAPRHPPHLCSLRHLLFFFFVVCSFAALVPRATDSPASGAASGALRTTAIPA
jgi:hypothetical protein